MPTNSLKRLSAMAGAAVFAVLALSAPSPAQAAAPHPDGQGRGLSTLADLRDAGVRLDVASVTCSTQSFPVDCWVIEPAVNVSSAFYPNIQFVPGQRVTVFAGGCVQTGGKGLTWKRYVDPMPDQGLYYGTINVPGATTGLQALRFVVGRTLVVGANGGSLQLGYIDDGYGDNGYTSHDNGTGNQCRNVENAWVHIVIG